MSEQGLETIETTVQKTHEWIARIAESMHMERRDAWQSLRSVAANVARQFSLKLGGAFRSATTNARARPLSRRLGTIESAN